MEEKFCKFCGQKLDEEKGICLSCESTSGEIVKETKSEKFYQTQWFLWIMLLFCLPIGLILLWAVNKSYKKSTKIIITIVFALLSLIFLPSSNDESVNNVNKYETSSKIKVAVADFDTMNKQSADSWCDTNKINCNIKNEYSDTVAKGKLINQSVTANTSISQGDKITITYSNGQKPSLEYLNALEKAKSYAETQHMSKQGIYEQLISPYGEQFTKTEAQYAINNLYK